MVVAGLIAGVVGTAALDAATYLDILVRGRDPSPLPGESAARLAGRLGLDLAGQDGAAENRRSALGSLLGTFTGAGVGAAYGLAARRRPGSRLAEAALLAGLATVVANGSLIAQGLTDPRRWGLVDWLADLIPHLAYGAAASAALGRL